MWSFASVILFYIALTEQRKDFKTNNLSLNAQTEALKLQIKEFELQRKELEDTREVFKIQSQTIKKQQFESTFFNLLNLHHNITNSIDVTLLKDKYTLWERSKIPSAQHKDKIEEKYVGRDSFVYFRNKFTEEFSNKFGFEFENELEKVNTVYLRFYEEHQSDLGHYFRNLYHIFKFIKTSNEEDKNTYMSLVRAQLSNDELFLLFYNCLSELGREKFKPLIEEFHLLQNINFNTILSEEHIKEYNDSAF